MQEIKLKKKVFFFNKMMEEILKKVNEFFPLNEKQLLKYEYYQNGDLLLSLDRNGKLHSYNDLPSEINIKEKSIKYHKHGTLHRTRGYAIMNFKTGYVCYYYEGYEI